MEFQTKIILLSFVMTVVLAFIIIPILKKLKIGQIERVEGPQSHLKKQGTPTMGGIIFIVATMISMLLLYYFKKIKQHINNIKTKKILILRG